MSAALGVFRTHRVCKTKNILASSFLLQILGVPFAWRKFRGGTERNWIGFLVFARERRLGVSQSRADWLSGIGWIRLVRAEGRVRVGDLKAVVARLSFCCHFFGQTWGR